MRHSDHKKVAEDGFASDIEELRECNPVPGPRDTRDTKMLCSVGLRGSWRRKEGTGGEGSSRYNKKKVENVFIEKFGGLGKLFGIEGRRVPQMVGKGVRRVGKNNRVVED